MSKYLLFLSALFLLTCESSERIWSNPNDPDSDRDAWSPTNLTIEQISVTQIELTWNDNADGEDGFKIDRKIDDGVWEIGYGEVEEDKIQWIDTSSVPHSINHYRLYAFARENSSEMIEKSINPSFPTPTNLQVIQISDVEIKLTWEDNSYGEDGYRIDRKVGDGIWNIGYGDVGSDIEEWNDSEPIYGEFNYYRIYAYNGDYASSSLEGSIENIIPVPSDLVVTFNMDEDQMELQWIDNCSFEGNVTVERKINSESFGIIATLGSNETNFIDDQIQYSDYYTYRVFASTNNNQSLSSNEDTKRYFYSWNFNFAGTGRSVVEVDDGYIVIDINQTIKLSNKGVQLWTQSYGGYHIEKTTDGNYIISGYQQLYKITTAGSLIWSKGNSCDGRWVEECQDGGYIIAGDNLVRTDPNGNTIWDREVNDGWSASSYEAVTQIPDGTFIVSGKGNNYDMTIWNINDEGTLLWSGKRNTDYSAGYSILADSGGDYIVSGQDDGNSNCKWLLVKFDSDGTILWDKSLGWGPDSRNGTSIVQDSYNNYIISGATYAWPDRIFAIAKTDSNGNIIWKKEYGNELAWDLIITSDDGLVAVGDFVIKTDEDGNLLNE